MHSFTLGADPEFFLLKDTLFAAAINIIPGTKTAPQPINTEGASIQVDNVACEFNTVPAESPTEFHNNIMEPYNLIKDLIEAQNFIISREAFGEFPESELQDPSTKEAGCEPDYCAYTGEMNTPPCLHSTNARSAAGHLHIGLPLDNQDELMKFIKTLDLYITIPSLHLETAQRRTLYGKAGCFRVKPYGVEYRTPSNHWIFHPARISWVWDQVSLAVQNFKDIELPSDLESIINNNNLKQAEKLIQKYNLTVCPEM